MLHQQQLLFFSGRSLCHYMHTTYQFCIAVALHWLLHMCILNPRRTCAARVTVLSVCVCVSVSVSTLAPTSLVYICTWKIRCAKFYFSLFLDFIVRKLLREKANMLMSTCLPQQCPVLLQRPLAQCFDDRDCLNG